MDTVTGNHDHSSSRSRGELAPRPVLGDLSLLRQPHQQEESPAATDLDHLHHSNGQGHGHGASPSRRRLARPASGGENGAENSVTSTLETLAKLKRLCEN